MNQHRNDGLPGLLSCWFDPSNAFSERESWKSFSLFLEKAAGACSAGHIHIAQAQWKGIGKTAFAKVLWVCSKHCSQCCWPPGNKKQLLTCFPRRNKRFIHGHSQTGTVSQAGEGTQMSGHMLADMKWAMN